MSTPTRKITPMTASACSGRRGRNCPNRCRRPHSPSWTRSAAITPSRCRSDSTNQAAKASWTHAAFRRCTDMFWKSARVADLEAQVLVLDDRLTRATTERDYWKKKAEQLLDMALFKRGEITAPVFE